MKFRHLAFLAALVFAVAPLSQASAETNIVNGQIWVCEDGMCRLVGDAPADLLASLVPSASVPEEATRMLLGTRSVDEFLAFLSPDAVSGDAEGGALATFTWLSLVVVLLGGLAMNLTPCVLPMIPVNLIVIGKSPARGAVYGLGMALAYGVLGVLAAVGGMAMNAAGPTKGHLERLSDGVAPKEIVFIQCVGSRCSDSRGKPYCSKICCMYTAKHAMLIRDKYPDVNVTVFYIDVRTPGKNFDEFYRRAVEEYGVNYIKGQVGKVAPQADGSLLVQGVDLLDNKQIKMKADMVVLATAIEPNEGVRNIATMLTASIDTNNFLTEAHPKLRPVESPTAGVFLSGVCQGPKDIPETVSQAGAAAVKVIGLLAKDKLTTNPCTAKPDELLCNGCSNCAKVCPYGAITYEVRQVNDHGIREDRRIAVVNSALCQGCGACTVTCPSGAMDLQGFSNRQLIAEVDAICR